MLSPEGARQSSPKEQVEARHELRGGFISVGSRLREVTPFVPVRPWRPARPASVHTTLPGSTPAVPPRRHRAVRQRRHRRVGGAARHVAGDDAGGDDPAPPASPLAGPEARP